MAKDPVCGMQVGETKAEWKSTHMGETHYFCSPGCKGVFDKNPMKYMGAGDHSSQAHHGHPG